MNPNAPRVAPHVWNRGGDAEQYGAIIYVGRKNIFVTTEQIDAVIEALTAVKK